MTCLIISGPIPIMFILDKPSLLAPRGIIQPNAFSRKPLFTGTTLSLRMVFSPQKVKKIVTSWS
ncbi:Uncharacterised protein [Mycobacterium tuberculosis]|nr:Uncharacterised protein [Mycobacterium tuberculosis]